MCMLSIIGYRNPRNDCVPKSFICVLLHRLNKKYKSTYSAFLYAFKMTYLTLKEIGGAEAQMLQHAGTYLIFIIELSK